MVVADAKFSSIYRMNRNVSLFLLYTITLSVIGLLLYFVVFKPEKKIIIKRELPRPQSFESHWWGYGWRPWWKKYNGLPGLGTVKPAKMPVAPKPVVV